MGVHILLIAALIRTVTPFNFVEDPESIHSCDIGDVIQNGRITCTCTQNYVYECIFKNPSKNQLGKSSHRKMVCQPNKIYVQETITCICNYNGTWPHSACGDVFDSLPLKDVVKTKCEPDGYVFIGCNVCRCDSKGYIDKSRCTKNECHTSVKSPEIRRSTKASNVYGNCEAKNWYSLAPCQFCFCLNENKLVCNTGNYNTQKLQLGSYNLNVCGKELIREAIELIPEDDKTLRHGEGTSNIPTTSKPTRPTVAVSNGNIDIDVTFDDKQSQEIQLNTKHNDRPEEIDRQSYSESVEDKGDYDIVNKEETKLESTQLPYQDDYQVDTKESRELIPEKKDDMEDGTDNEIVDPGLKIPAKLQKEKKYTTPPMIKNLEDLGQQLKLSLPIMLDKVFRMALRKSMVTIDKDSQCVPGAVNTVQCNTCFCLKNSKLLCTNKKCD